MTGTRWTTAWNKRPWEEAAFFNPAFCGELLFRAFKDYWGLSASPFPLPLAFVVLPLVLHPTARSAMPGRSDVGFATWASGNDAVLAQMSERIIQLRPVTREALLFLAQIKAVTIGEAGILVGESPLKLSATVGIISDETNEIKRKAALAGRWFASQATAPLVLQSMGVRV